MEIMTRKTDRTLKRQTLSLALCLALAGGATAYAAMPHGENWPCIQRKVLDLSVGALWQGPQIDIEDSSWTEDPDVVRLVNRVSQRRLSMEDAQKEIEEFVEALEGDKEEKLAQVFNGLFQTISVERKTIISGIERYTLSQRALADRVREGSRELVALQINKDRTEEETKRMNELLQQFEWDARIHQEREQALEAVCESPVILEQRLFGLSRAIQSHL
jgi:hypothetical protein